MNAKTKDTIGVFFIAALVAFLIALIPTCGQAQTVQQWQAADDACRGAQIDPDRNPACKRREKIQNALYARGLEETAAGVWISADDVGVVKGFLRGIENQCTGAHAWYAAIEKARREVGVSQETLIAVWNEHFDYLREQYPCAAPIFRGYLHYLHAQAPNDVSLMLTDYQ